MGKSIALQAGPGILSTSNYYLACGDDQRVIASTGFSDASDRSNRECRHAKHLPGLGKSIQEGHKFFFCLFFSALSQLGIVPFVLKGFSPQNSLFVELQYGGLITLHLFLFHCLSQCCILCLCVHSVQCLQGGSHPMFPL